MREDRSAALEEPSSATAAQQDSEEPDSSSSGGEEASDAGLTNRAQLRRRAAPRQPLIDLSESEPEGARLAVLHTGVEEDKLLGVPLFHSRLKLRSSC